MIKTKIIKFKLELIYNQFMKPTRKSTSSLILDFIHKNQTVSVRELSLSLGVTRANITYHLRRLRGNGMVELIPPRNKTGRGRQEQRFQLASGVRANNYRVLCETLLRLIGESEMRGKDEFTLIGERLAEQVSLVPGLPAQRLNRLCAHLNRHGYQASWIAGRQGAQIIFKNCPYADLVTNLPELCRMDCAMLTRSLSSAFVQIEKFSFHTGMAGACRFSAIP